MDAYLAWPEKFPSTMRFFWKAPEGPGQILIRCDESTHVILDCRWCGPLNLGPELESACERVVGFLVEDFPDIFAWPLS